MSNPEVKSQILRFWTVSTHNCPSQISQNCISVQRGLLLNIIGKNLLYTMGYLVFPNKFILMTFEGKKVEKNSKNCHVTRRQQFWR